MSKKSKTKSKKSKFSFSIIILIIFLFLLVNANLFTNAGEVNSKEISNANIKDTELQTQDTMKENNTIDEKSSDEIELDIKKSAYGGKIDLTPEKPEAEPEFIDIKMLRLENDPLLETKLNHYMNSLIDVVQYKIEKNKNNLEKIDDKIINNLQQIEEHHNIIDESIKQQNAFQNEFKNHLKIMQIIIIFLSVIGLIVAVLIYFIWRSFVNVNKNQVEVIEITENINHLITDLQNEINMLKKKI